VLDEDVEPQGRVTCALSDLIQQIGFNEMDSPLWVSGSTETKTYGKSATVREYEEQQTLPSRGLFGKDADER